MTCIFVQHLLVMLVAIGISHDVNLQNGVWFYINNNIPPTARERTLKP